MLLTRLNSRRSLLDKGLEGFETGSFGLRVGGGGGGAHNIKFAGGPPTKAQVSIRSRGKPKNSMRSHARSPLHIQAAPIQTLIDVKVTTDIRVDETQGSDMVYQLDARKSIDVEDR